MDEKDALARVKTDLSRSWLVAPSRVADLALSSSEPMHCGEFEIRSVFVDRDVEDVEEPLSGEPGTASRLFEMWSVEWPPTSEAGVKSGKIDVRSSYEVAVCQACSRAGEVACGVCRGSGKVADAKTGRPIRCNTCKGKGTVRCARCAGRGQLLRFKRIAQKVKTVSSKVRLPTGTKIPSGAPSGEVSYFAPTPGGGGDVNGSATKLGSLDEVPPAAPRSFEEETSVALKNATPRLSELGWLEVLTKQFVEVEPPKGMGDARAAWRTIEGRWYEGWKLACATRGKSATYFVPDTAAKIVGPRLHSPVKIGAIVGAIVLLLGAAGFVQKSRSDAAHAAQVAQKQREADQQAEKDKQAAKESADKAAAERRAAEQRAQAEKQAAIAKVRDAAAKLVMLKDKSADERRSVFEALSAATDATVGAPEIRPINDATASAEELLGHLRELRVDLPANDPAPDKPVYTKPEYSGVFFLSGTYRFQYETLGIVMQRGQDFFVVYGASTNADQGEPSQGWVECGTDTITVDIGRSGRQARSCEHKEKEDYDDDQKSYTQTVKDAQANYQQQMSDYNAELKTWHDAENKASQEKATREVDRKKTKAQLDTEIVKLIPVLASLAPPASTSSQGHAPASNGAP